MESDNKRTIPRNIGGKTPRDIPGNQGQPRQRRRMMELPRLETTFGVEIAGTTAVASSPPRPGKPQLHLTTGRPDEMPEQVTNERQW